MRMQQSPEKINRAYCGEYVVGEEVVRAIATWLRRVET
jgi:hypothetical protein